MVGGNPLNGPQRHQPEPLSYARLVCSSPDILDKYYDLLENTLEENNLMDKP